MYTIRASYNLGRHTYVEVRDYENYTKFVFVESAYRGLNTTTPTIKEFCLNLQRWNQLVWNLEEIKLAVDDQVEGKEIRFTQHLGGNHYVRVNSGFEVVDLRRFWLPDGQSEIRATRNGIALKFDEFRKLTSFLPHIEKVVPELTDVQPCYMEPDHANLLGALYCSECNPNFTL